MNYSKKKGVLFIVYLEVTQYDELYQEVAMKYPTLQKEKQHDIALKIYEKMQNDRKQYIDTYHRTNNQTIDSTEQLETLNNNFHEFMRETRSYRTWTTRYRGPSI